MPGEDPTDNEQSDPHLFWGFLIPARPSRGTFGQTVYGSAVKVFEMFQEFRGYTLQGRMYPIEEENEYTFLPVFLKKVLRKRRL
jgi:hypothetical protein